MGGVFKDTPLFQIESKSNPMKKSQEELKDRTYKLLRKAAPLSFMLPTRNTKRFPLLYFDPDKQINRALRYARNQKSPFEDEQDGNVVLEPVIFIDGFLNVPKDNPILQRFLYYHPLNGKYFAEDNKEKDAEVELEKLNVEADALSEARHLTVEQLETVGRVLLGRDVTKITTSELRRDVIVSAKKDPKSFLNILKDPELQLQAKTQQFFDNKLLTFRNNNKELWLNLPNSKRKLMLVPFGDNPMVSTVAYLKTDEGIEVLKLLEKNLEAED